MSSVPPDGSYTPPPPPPSVPPTGNGGGGIVYPTTPPKDPVVILLLNLFILGGVGYLVLGQKMKGIVAIAACVVLAVPTCGAGTFLVAVAAAIDGYLQAQQLQQGHPVGEWTFFNDHR